MRSRFSGYFSLAPSEVDVVWEQGFVVVDTNVLLNLYRFMSATRRSLITTLKALEDRLWLPEQVALEFQRNRVGVIRTQQKTLDGLAVTLQELSATVDGRLRAHSRNPVLAVESLTTELRVAFAACSNKVEKVKETFDVDYGVTPQRDPILDELGTLFEGRVGSAYGPDELVALFKEGERRYADKIPPGYKDDRKLDGRNYGDLVLWRQLLDEAKSRQRPVILVTDDEKEDWWWQSEGETLGPRPELRQEFRDFTGCDILLYRTPSFLHAASERSIVPVSKSSVEEAEQLLTHDGRVDDEERLARSVARQNRLADQLRKAEALQEQVGRQLNILQAANPSSGRSPEVLALQQKLRSIEAEQLLLYRQAATAPTREAREEAEQLIAKLEERRRTFETVLGPTASQFDGKITQHAMEVAAARSALHSATQRVSELRSLLRSELDEFELALEAKQDGER